MRKASARVLGAMTVAVLVSSLLLACSPGTDTTGSVQVQSGQDAMLTVGDDDGLVIKIPGSSLSGAGTLRAEVAAAQGGIEGWTIELSGSAELIGPATLRFAHDFEEGEPAPLVAWTEDEASYHLAENVTVEDDGIVVETTHFSNWFTMWWDDVLKKARATLDAIYRDAGKQPTCKNESAVRDANYSITSDDGNRVHWCLGMGKDNTPSLKAVNGRGYTVAAEHTPGLTVADAGASELIMMISNVFKERPSNANNEVTLVGPGSGVRFDVSGHGDMGVRFKPSVGGYLVTAAQYAVDTLAMVLPYAGKGGMSTTEIAKLFNWASCLSGFGSMSSSEVQTATQASNYFTDAVGTALGCLDEALVAAGLSFWGTAVASGLSWLISGIRTALNGFGAAADTALNPSGYTIYVKAPTAGMPGLPVALSGEWCTRIGEKTCFNAGEIMSEHPAAFVDGEGYEDPDVPGSVQYSICLEEEFSDGGCTTASTIYIKYFPVGSSWDCQSVKVDREGWPACEPDYTAAHDSTQPRLLVLPNHQQDSVFHDSPPMYKEH